MKNKEDQNQRYKVKTKEEEKADANSQKVEGAIKTNIQDNYELELELNQQLRTRIKDTR